MKRAIKWLARVSGVEKEIRNHQQEIDASFIDGASYYFSGRPQIYNALQLAAQHLKRYGVIYTDKIRDKVYEHEDKLWHEVNKKA